MPMATAMGRRAALAWAPIGSLRFWVFLFTFGGGAGLALTKLGSSAVVAAVGALGDRLGRRRARGRR